MPHANVFYLKDTRVVGSLEYPLRGRCCCWRGALGVERGQKNRTTEKMGTAPDRHHPNVQVARAPWRAALAKPHPAGIYDEGSISHDRAKEPRVGLAIWNGLVDAVWSLPVARWDVLAPI